MRAMVLLNAWSPKQVDRESRSHFYRQTACSAQTRANSNASRLKHVAASAGLMLYLTVAGLASATGTMEATPNRGFAGIGVFFIIIGN
jgi:hypothetical protein